MDDSDINVNVNYINIEINIKETTSSVNNLKVVRKRLLNSNNIAAFNMIKRVTISDKAF